MNYSKLLISFGLLLSSALVANAQEAVDKTNSTDEKETFRITVNTNSPSTWALEWQDDFDQATIDEENWSKIEPYPSNNPDWRKNISTYDGCFDFKDSNIILKGIENPGKEITGDDRQYLCGGITSSGKKLFQNGRIEIKAKMGSARGAWPALWMMPQEQSAGWPGCGEIDIMEHLNYDGIVYQTLHSNYTYNVSKTDPLSNVTRSANVGEYNIYGVELGLDTLRMLLNDEVTFTYYRNGAKDQFPFDKEFYLKLDMQLGGSWVGAVTGEGLPVEMAIDWVKFYKKHYEYGEAYIIRGEDNLGNAADIERGKKLTLKVVPAKGYEIGTLTVNQTDIKDKYLENGFYSFLATKDREFYVEFIPEGSSIKETETKAKVYTENNILNIETSQPSQVEIYSLTGIKLSEFFCDQSTKTELEQGYYIVKINNKTFKVVCL